MAEPMNLMEGGDLMRYFGALAAHRSGAMQRRTQELRDRRIREGRAGRLTPEERAEFFANAGVDPSALGMPAPQSIETIRAVQDFMRTSPERQMREAQLARGGRTVRIDDQVYSANGRPAYGDARRYQGTLSDEQVGMGVQTGGLGTSGGMGSSLMRGRLPAPVAPAARRAPAGGYLDFNEWLAAREAKPEDTGTAQPRFPDKVVVARPSDPARPDPSRSVVPAGEPPARTPFVEENGVVTPLASNAARPDLSRFGPLQPFDTSGFPEVEALGGPLVPIGAPSGYSAVAQGLRWLAGAAGRGLSRLVSPGGGLVASQGGTLATSMGGLNALMAGAAALPAFLRRPQVTPPRPPSPARIAGPVAPPVSGASQVVGSTVVPNAAPSAAGAQAGQLRIAGPVAGPAAQSGAASSAAGQAAKPGFFRRAAPYAAAAGAGGLGVALLAGRGGQQVQMEDGSMVTVPVGETYEDKVARRRGLVAERGIQKGEARALRMGKAGPELLSRAYMAQSPEATAAIMAARERAMGEASANVPVAQAMMQQAQLQGLSAVLADPNATPEAKAQAQEQIANMPPIVAPSIGGADPQMREMGIPDYRGAAPVEPLGVPPAAGSSVSPWGRMSRSDDPEEVRLAMQHREAARRLEEAERRANSIRRWGIVRDVMTLGIPRATQAVQNWLGGR